MRLLLDVLLRLAAVLAVDVIFWKVVDIPGDDGLGTGLLAFATLILLSGAWGLVDGFRRPYVHLAITWVVTGVAYAVLSVLLRAVLFPPVDWDVVGSDLVTLVPFSTGLVVVPALLAGVLGLVARSGNDAAPDVQASRRNG